SFAYVIAGFKTSVNGRFPNFFDNLAQAPGAPGMVTGIQPYLGILSYLFSLTASIEILFGDFPLPFKPCNFPFIHTKANRSPPIPLDVGSTTVKQAAVAMAASTAFPPFFKIVIPASAASG